MGLFRAEGTFMTMLARIIDLIWLNFLFLVCSIPFFTIGASITALSYVTMKMTEDNEGYITRSFFSAFRQNFKQATAIFALCLFLCAVFGIDFLVLVRNGHSILSKAGLFLCIPFFCLLITIQYVFALLARFDNSVKNTIKNALMVAIANMPRTLLMLLISVGIPFLCLCDLHFLPLFLICAFSLSAYMNAFSINKIFSKYMSRENTSLAEIETNYGEHSQGMGKDEQ